MGINGIGYHLSAAVVAYLLSIVRGDMVVEMGGVDGVGEEELRRELDQAATRS